MASVVQSLIQTNLHGNAYALPQAVRDVLDERIHPSLLARKGLLFPVYAQGVSEQTLQDIYTTYYGGTSFDILPNLRRALIEVYRTDADSVDGLVGVALLQERELYLVGQKAFTVTLVRSRSTQPILEPWRQPSRPQSDQYNMHGGTLVIYSTFQRLLVGDTIVMTTSSVAKARTTKRLAAMVRNHQNPSAIAMALSRTRQKGHAKEDHRPAAVIRVPGFQAVEGFPQQPAQVNHPKAPTAPQLRSKGSRSPIWTALLVAVIAITLAWYVGQPDLSANRMQEIIDWALTPVITETPTTTETPSTPAPTAAAQENASGPTAFAPPTRTPRPVIAAPAQSSDPTNTPPQADQEAREFPPIELIEPANDSIIRGRDLTLRWKWKGELAQDEFFDVRLWKIGTDPKGIAWTKNTQYTERVLTESGWHEWTVIVVQGVDGVVVEELTTNRPVNAFQWHPDASEQEPDVPPTAPPPTRIAPEPEPTRVTPGG